MTTPLRPKSPPSHDCRPPLCSTQEYLCDAGLAVKIDHTCLTLSNAPTASMIGTLCDVQETLIVLTFDASPIKEASVQNSMHSSCYRAGYVPDSET